jgi:hypothetical protein
MLMVVFLPLLANLQMKIKMKKSLVYAVFFSSLFALAQNNRTQRTISITNSLPIARSFETISLSKKQLQLKKSDKLEDFGIKEKGNSSFLVTQVVDENLDGEMDVLLVQPFVKAASTTILELVSHKKTVVDSISCYSRFVPERTDDYAWENDKVAFRTYGPRAQEMIEKNIKGGTLSSGIDAWLKRVPYPIINKWYEKTTNGTGSYHIDSGEGLDNFHVGSSRGIGGIAVQQDSTYYFSKNFTSYKTITTGPIRTSFILTYANWDANGKEITETKTISLDLGSYLSKFTIAITGTPQVAVGLTLHNKKGTIGTNVKEGWLSYWEPIDDSEIGSGLVVPNKKMTRFDHYVTTVPDLSNLYGSIAVKSNKIAYYAGFAWKKGSPFQNKQQWEKYLSDFSLKVNHPLHVKVTKK